MRARTEIKAFKILVASYFDSSMRQFGAVRRSSHIEGTYIPGAWGPHMDTDTLANLTQQNQHIQHRNAPRLYYCCIERSTGGSHGIDASCARSLRRTRIKPFALFLLFFFKIYRLRRHTGSAQLAVPIKARGATESREQRSIHALSFLHHRVDVRA